MHSRSSARRTNRRHLSFAALLALLQACACDEADEADEADEGPLARVSIDVIVDGDAASIYVRPLNNTLRCSFEPRLDGTCGHVSTDVIRCTRADGITPATVDEMYGCVSDLRVGAARVTEAFGLSGVARVAIRDEETATLTIVGCGDDIEVPLLAGPVAPTASASDLRRIDVDRADALVAAEDASHARICMNSGFTTHCCDGAPGRVPLPLQGEPGRCPPSVTLEALSGPTTTEAASGVIRVWRRTTTLLPTLLAGVPEPRDDGRYEATVCLEGEAPPLFTQLVFDPLDDSRFSLIDLEQAIEIELGRDEDTVRLTTEGKTYAGSVAHDPIDRALPLGVFEELPLDVGPTDVVLTNVEDALDTQTFVLALSGTIGALARP